MYGGGNEQLFNSEKFIGHLKRIQELNLSYTILFIITIFFLFVFLFKPAFRFQNRKKFRLLVAILVATFIEAIMVSKQLKSYYFTPVLAMSGLISYVIWDISKHRFKVKSAVFNLFAIVILLGLITPNLSVASHSINTLKKIKGRQLTVDFINHNRKPNDWFFLEPSWKSGPMVENGLLWGISYVAGRNEFYNAFKTVYPRVVAFEGENRPISQFRCGPANEQSMMESGDDIYLISLPGDQTNKRIDQLKSLAVKYNTTIMVDTVFVNNVNHDMILKARHIEPQSPQ